MAVLPARCYAVATAGWQPGDTDPRQPGRQRAEHISGHRRILGGRQCHDGNVQSEGAAVGVHELPQPCAHDDGFHVEPVRSRVSFTVRARTPVMNFSFSDHVALLNEFLVRHQQIVEDIQSRLLNVRGKDPSRNRSRGFLKAHSTRASSTRRASARFLPPEGTISRHPSCGRI